MHPSTLYDLPESGCFVLPSRGIAPCAKLHLFVHMKRKTTKCSTFTLVIYECQPLEFQRTLRYPIVQPTLRSFKVENPAVSFDTVTNTQLQSRSSIRSISILRSLYTLVQCLLKRHVYNPPKSTYCTSLLKLAVSQQLKCHQYNLKSSFISSC